MGIVITGGKLRGRRLPGRVGAGVRPSSARVREALFSMVGQQLDGVSVLDAFAGTGLLGFEAVSRGAESLTVVEREPRTMAALQARAKQLGVAVEAYTGALPAVLPKGRTWDLVLADPPYDKDFSQVLVDLQPFVGDRLVLEHQSDWEPVGNTEELSLFKHRIYGNSALSIYERRLA